MIKKQIFILFLIFIFFSNCFSFATEENTSYEENNNDVSIYQENVSEYEEAGENETIEENNYSEILDDINQNIYETNNILFALIFIITCWFIIDFLRNSFKVR